MHRLLSFLLVLLFSCSAPEQRMPDADGEVVAVADGDTFTLLTPENEQVKVRLFGIDCPERGQDYYSVAKQHLSDLVFRKPVRLDVQDKDRYGRSVAIVFDAEGRNVNEAMLSAGLAWHYTQYSKNPEWDALQAEARKARRGLWQQKGAQAPWLWRKERRNAAAQ
ncbi:MAG TPA: thermonuclease family protein [Chitinophagaceae bacterium]|jgi:endonuclease YncB( thermonuclease family)|nr:thermonuclease family protein [Chitinophagaceae bacterium]